MSSFQPAPGPVPRAVHACIRPTHHADPAHCDTGFRQVRCPACEDFMRDHAAVELLVAEASDVQVRDALHWLAGQEPSVVRDAIKAVTE